MPGRIEFEVNFSKSALGARRREQGPMHILIMGDFTGIRADESGLEEPSPQRIDYDNFDQVMAKIAPRLEITLDETNADILRLDFKALEDFHPDNLFERLAIFQNLKDLRAKLGNPATFHEAAALIGMHVSQESPQSTNDEVTSKPGENPPAAGEGIFDQLLGDRSANIAAEPTAIKGSKRVDINAFIKSAISPHIETGAPPQQQNYIASVDQTIGELMRAILHHPRFQALEAAWRGAYECISRLELDEEVKIYLLNVSKFQLQNDLDACSGDISTSTLYKILVENTVQVLGGQPWSLLVGLYTFGNDDADVDLLNALGQLAYSTGGPFIGGAQSRILGCDNIITQTDARKWEQMSAQRQQRWNELRDSAHASWIALTFPRFLLRMPYGKKAEETERFAFEEFTDAAQQQQIHEQYLWGNSALLCAALIAQSFQQNGWSMELGDVLEMGDLPLHVFDYQGDRCIKPCAEAAMTEHAAQAIENLGIMPLMSYKDRNTVRLWRFRSLSRDNPGLSGPWAG